ncbi:glycosyltransferase family 4 protein [Psychrobacillus vulpis]|uniref:Glycosyltransferase family 4 protein n=1 Tax=Psychrobacillus vulpis TaxID=2325572 RepID=A0A544TIR6_9BACI|nr:glycosyltransferase family 4 protein [Psychrobacillus vulpis]TQR17340.1 glycosyltransferase family 4 protein [Psychrobacillus vulpis]
MKIVQLITHMNEIGGAQVHVRDLSKQLAMDGHPVTIISGGDEIIADGLLIEEVTYMHSKFLIRKISFIKDFLAFLEIRKKLKLIKPDIVAIHSSKAGIIGRIACWSLRIPSVFTAHGWAFTEGVEKKKQRLYLSIEKWVGKLSMKVITVCDQDRNLALRHQVLPSEKIITVHNGVMDSKNTSLEKGNREVVKILMVARFEKPKQQLELLEALLHIKHLNWQMIFVGDGSLKRASAQFVQENYLGHKVTFLGSHSNVAGLLSDADLFVLTSAWEGLPLSILEAMLHSLPIIASNVGGVKEAVRDTENGFLIRNNLSELLSILIENELLRKNMGEKSREIYEASFTFEKMYTKTISTYRNLIVSGENG